MYLDVALEYDVTTLHSCVRNSCMAVNTTAERSKLVMFYFFLFGVTCDRKISLTV